MPKVEKIKFIEGQQSDDHFTSLAISSVLNEVTFCSSINQSTRLNLRKISDLQMWLPNDVIVGFSFYFSDDSISKTSTYIISNVGKELNCLTKNTGNTLFEDNSPRIFNLFGAQQNSVFNIKGIKPDYFLIIKHPFEEFDVEKWIRTLRDINQIQPISVQSKEYQKHYLSLMNDIEVHIGDFEVSQKRDNKRKKEMLKVKMNALKNSIGKITYDQY